VYRPARGRYAPREGVESAECVGPPVVDLVRQQPDGGEILGTHRTRAPDSLLSAQVHQKLSQCPPLPGRMVPPCAARAQLRAGSRLSALARRAGMQLFLGVAGYFCHPYLLRQAWRTRRRGRSPDPPQAPTASGRFERSGSSARLECCPALRDKALLGILYACGLRVSEACRLRWADIDLERKNIRIWRGKGMKDRYVMLPACMEPLFSQGKKRCLPQDFVFVGDRPGRHLSPRTGAVRHGSGRAHLGHGQARDLSTAGRVGEVL
jgi:hypothetical protein